MFERNSMARTAVRIPYLLFGLIGACDSGTASDESTREEQGEPGLTDAGSPMGNSDAPMPSRPDNPNAPATDPSDTPEASTTEPGPVCAQGETRQCVGRGACEGGQFCSEGGLWGECECGSGPTPPEPVASQGGDAGMSTVGPPANGGAGPSTPGAGGTGGVFSFPDAGVAGGPAGSGGFGGVPPEDVVGTPEYLREHYGVIGLRDRYLFAEGLQWAVSASPNSIPLHAPGDSLTVLEPRQGQFRSETLPCFRAEGPGMEEVVREDGGTHYLAILLFYEDLRVPINDAFAFRVEGLLPEQSLVAQLNFWQWNGDVTEYTLISVEDGTSQNFTEFPPPSGMPSLTPAEDAGAEIFTLFALGPGPFDFCVTELFVK